MMWWVNTDKAPGAPQVILSLSFLSRTGVEMQWIKLVGSDKNREITQQLLLWKRQISLEKLIQFIANK